MLRKGGKLSGSGGANLKNLLGIAEKKEKPESSLLYLSP